MAITLSNSLEKSYLRLKSRFSYLLAPAIGSIFAIEMRNSEENTKICYLSRLKLLKWKKVRAWNLCGPWNATT